MGALVLFIVGLVLLIGGAELVIRGAKQVAATLGVSPMFIGLTIVSIGTSAPELAIGVIAGLRGNGGLAVGNIAGTNLVNLLFILGLSALIRSLPLKSQILKLELPAIVVAAVLMMVLAWDGVLSRWDGLIMLAAGVGYTTALFIVTSRTSTSAAKPQPEHSAEESPPAQPNWTGNARQVAILVVGLGLTVLGADWLVRGAVEIAESLGVSPTVIGLTIVAIGTSAPELVTTIISTFKNDRDVAVGNLLGSSIYNILLILSISCLVSPRGLPVERRLILFDIPLMAGVAILAIPVFITGKRISRVEGGVCVAVYAAYLTWLVLVRH